MKYSEPCYCGSPDCRRCFPLTWDQPPPEFCEECNYAEGCADVGCPSKTCSKYMDLAEPDDLYEDIGWKTI